MPFDVKQPDSIILAANVLGEGVLWDDTAGLLWWTDIQSSELLRYDWTQQTLERSSLPHRLGSFGFITGSSDIVAAFERGIAFYHPNNAALEWILQPAMNTSHMRFNDGRVDRQGRFWTGTMVQGVSPRGEATLYCVDTDGAVREREQGLGITNGICSSPDGRRLYLADSPRAIIYCYELDPDDGTLHHRRVFARTTGDVAPDGANVDEDGCVWSAQWGGSSIVRYTPYGEIDRVLEVPVSQPTCVAFGGPELDLLFVSTAREGLSARQLAEQPHAGDVLMYRTNVRGLPEPRFRGDSRPSERAAVG